MWQALIINYLLNILAAISQLFNSTLGGHPNMTVSARAHCSQAQPVWKLLRVLINSLFFWQDDHCKKSWQQDEIFCDQLCCGKDAADKVV